MKKGEDKDMKLTLAFGLAVVGILVIAMIMAWLVASMDTFAHYNKT